MKDEGVFAWSHCNIYHVFCPYKEVFVDILGSLGTYEGRRTPRKREGNTARRGMTWSDPEGRDVAGSSHIAALFNIFLFPRLLYKVVSFVCVLSDLFFLRL